jgi:hypothetical protein
MFQMYTTLQFQCCECFHLGILDIQGCCKKCGSDSVISQELIRCQYEHELPLARSA